MNDPIYPIIGIPTEPGVYESKQFPLAEEYHPYVKYEDGAFHEGDRGDEDLAHQKINGDSEAADLGPFRKVSDLVNGEAS